MTDDGDGRPPFVGPLTEWVTCYLCGETLDPSNAEGIDISGDDEYYPEMRPVCPHHGGD